MPNLAEWATLATAVFTAGAAYAALQTARHGRRQIEDAERPQLDIQVTVSGPGGTLGLLVVNTGRGIARGARYVLHGLDQHAEGNLLDGFVRPGEKLYVRTGIGPVPAEMLAQNDPGVAAAVLWRDADGTAHYRTQTLQTYTPPPTLIRRRPTYPARAEALKRLFPDVDFDAAKPSPSRVTREP